MTTPKRPVLPCSPPGMGRVCTGSDAPCHRGNPSFAIFLKAAFCALMLALPGLLLAQSGSQGSQSDDGWNSGGYVIHSSVEAGYRAQDLTGSGSMYNTLVNLQTGPRVLDQTLSMRSADHQGVLLDDLSVSSSGWGGEPNNYLRMRVDKNKRYDLVTSFRRDQNFSDYNLLANPLNPPTSTPSIPALSSPNSFDTTRRMSDVDLTLLPQSKLSFRVGFSHNNMTGPSYIGVHEGTDALLLQPWNTTMSTYRMGVDWKALPRTVFSFDQYLDYYKGDTDSQLAPFAPALLPAPGTGSVELGLSIDTKNNVPCAVKAPATSLIDSTGTLTNTTCSAYFSYSRDQRLRIFTPTERVSMRSNYLQRLDLTGSFAYSTSDMNTPLNESFDGLITRTRNRAFTDTGVANGNRISNVFDLQGTLHLAAHLQLVNKFYYWNYRVPQSATFSEVDNICNGSCTLLTPLSATAPATTDTLVQSSFNQSWTRYQSDLVWDFSKKAGTRIGFRYGDQHFRDFPSYQAGAEDSVLAHEFTGLFGFYARPTHDLRLNFDAEHSNFDNVIFRMAPRKESRYRFQTTYTPRQWAVISGSINLLQDANANAATKFVGHNQNYGFTASLAPRERFGGEVAYNYNDAIQNALICFNDTPPAGVTLPFVSNAASCAAMDTANPLLANSYYTNHTHFGMTTVRLTPIKRFTTNVGYSITDVDGSIPQFNIQQPLGSSQYRYQQPVAGLSIDLGRGLAWNTGWNYYQYAEGSFVGPTAPRYFHANALTESLRYAF